MTTKPRSLWIAALLSIIQPGLGQIYNGQARKGIVLLITSFLLLSLYSLSLSFENIIAYLLTCIILAISFYIYVLTDAVITARRYRYTYNTYSLKRYNSLYVYIGILIFNGLIGTLYGEYIKSNFIQAFKIPSKSMESTLLVGDRLLVDRRTSKLKYKRGDIIVFKYPKDEKKDFIKRIVAAGGDEVLIKDKALYINGTAVSEPYTMFSGNEVSSMGVKKSRNFETVTVAKDHFFVLGDNRDNSHDSRHYGAVDKSLIKGIARNIYWSWNRDQKAIRWDRIGSKIE